jgi:catechol 2,3-dioxygenase-like lactoylglutathione lyase family enzyme
MFSHIVLGANDIDASKAFYDALFAAAGGNAGDVVPNDRVIYAKDGNRLMLTKPLNGEAATPANGGTIGFTMKDPEMVDAWHAAGIANGGTTCENPPGVRQIGPRQMYLAYLRDPAGNKLCAGAPAAE